jgi:SAM-dependent methyltransferase
MVEVARRLNPGILFDQADMLNLGLPDSSLAGIVAFYSMIHLARPAIVQALIEMGRVLLPSGLALVSVHGGEAELHADEFLGHEVLSREPYDFEFQSRRVYISAAKLGAVFG